MTEAIPSVSVVVPMHNVGDFVHTALDAALRQTHRSLEVIAVDDGSTDQTAAIVRSRKDRRVRYVRQDHRGQSAAINAGVRHSRGAFIKLLDADDWMNPEHIEAQMAGIAGADGAVSVCRWGYFVEDWTRPTVRPEYAEADYDDPLQWFVDCFARDEGMVGGGRWLIPRSIWEKTGGYAESLARDNDVHFCAKLVLAATAIRFAPGATYSYRKGVAGSMSDNRSRPMMESVFRANDMAATELITRRDRDDIRRIFADRLRRWLFCFYPEFPDLVARAEQRISELGGSRVQMQGGAIQRWLLPVLGWKGVRRLQSIAYRSGWQTVLDGKERRRLVRFH